MLHETLLTLNTLPSEEEGPGERHAVRSPGPSSSDGNTGSPEGPRPFGGFGQRPAVGDLPQAISLAPCRAIGMMADMEYAGIDGCRAGWVAAFVDGERCELEVYESFDAVWSACREARAVMVDMPVGLPWRALPFRDADVLARQALGPRRSSIFTVPCRAAVYAEEYASANVINRDHTGKGLSKQAYMIMRRIREVDGVLRADVEARKRVFEAHPELAFRYAAGEPMRWYKKHPLGFLERLRVLEVLYPDTESLLEYACSRYPKGDLTCDDCMDAVMLALSARAGAGRYDSLPKEPQEDEMGLPMAIWYHDFSRNR